MTWEALNNISDDNTRHLVIIVNDNGRSYAPTIGGMARFLNTRAHPPRLPQPAPLEPTSCSASSARPARAFYRGTRGGLHGFLPRFTQQRGAVLEPRHQVHRPGATGTTSRALEETLEQAKELRRARSSCT